MYASIESILSNHMFKPYQIVRLDSVEKHEGKQTKRGRPGPNTKYERVTKRGQCIF